MNNRERMIKITQLQAEFEKSCREVDGGYVFCAHTPSAYHFGAYKISIPVSVWEEGSPSSSSTYFYIDADGVIVDETLGDVSEHTVTLRREAFEKWLNLQ